MWGFFFPPELDATAPQKWQNIVPTNSTMLTLRGKQLTPSGVRGRSEAFQVLPIAPPLALLASLLMLFLSERHKARLCPNTLFTLGQGGSLILLSMQNIYRRPFERHSSCIVFLILPLTHLHSPSPPFYFDAHTPTTHRADNTSCGRVVLSGRGHINGARWEGPLTPLPSVWPRNKTQIYAVPTLVTRCRFNLEHASTAGDDTKFVCAACLCPVIHKEMAWRDCVVLMTCYDEMLYIYVYARAHTHTHTQTDVYISNLKVLVSYLFTV